MSNRDFKEAAISLLYQPVSHGKLCADFINSFWRARGFDPEARTEGAVVVSNMRNGFPTKRLAQ